MMKKLLLYVPVVFAILLTVALVSIGCGGATTGNYSDNFGIANPVMVQGVEDISSPLYTAGFDQDMTLARPTFEQMQNFLAQDITDQKPYVSGSFECRHFTTEVDNNAKTAGWQCGFVLICYEQGQHAVIAFNTTDRGLIFIEPQTDGIIDVYVGGTYQDLTIVEILIAW